jgi:dTDP-4-dehydrorhamnose 3,5-epimerase-like enzyme
MNKYNIFKHDIAGMSIHSDYRGLIADVFFDVSINHVAWIKSNKEAIRGNHYHKNTTQSILVVSGSLEYWYRESHLSENPAKMVIASMGDIVVSDMNEVHAMRILENDTLFIAFTEGIRGGSNYELDTFRVPNIVI